MATGGRQIFTSYNCQLCKSVDTEDMVQCDGCNLWFHFSCVGVTDDVADRDWSCSGCIEVLKAIQGWGRNYDPKKTRSHVSSKASTKKSLTSREKATALRKLDEEQKIRLDFLNKKYRILEQADSDSESCDEGKQLSVDYDRQWEQEIQNVSKELGKLTVLDDVSISLSDRERDVVNRISGSELKERLVEAKRQECNLKSFVLAGQQYQQMSHSKATDGHHEPEAECGVEKADLRRVFDKFWSDRQSGSIDKSKGAIPKVQRRMDPEVQLFAPKRVPEPHEREVTFNVQPVGSQQNIRWSTLGNLGENTPVRSKQANGTFDWDRFNSHSRRPIGNQNLQMSTVQPLIQNVSTPIRTKVVQQVVRKSGYVSNPVGVPLTQSQIASRHVFKNLPEFWGKAENWPLFLSSLLTSTAECGFSDGEKLGRLLKGLKGDAIDLVKSSLVHASAVPDVVDTLHLIFGRPNLVIHGMLEKITNTPSPKDDNLGSIIKYAIAVKNLCATIESSGDLSYLQNPILIQKLVDKLPTQSQLDWAYFKFGAGQVDLLVFGQWLYRLAQVATDVINPSSLKFGERRDRKNEGNRSNQSGHVNAQSETQEEMCDAIWSTSLLS